MAKDRPRLVVGIGASAGGLEAFKELLGVLPSDAGLACLIVQHLDPKHESLLVELLQPCTKMPVRLAEQGMPVASNTVYVIPPDTSLGIKDGRLELSQPKLHRGIRLPIDYLFRSLAEECGTSAVGIVMSGAGSDGSAGVRHIKGAGGLTIAEDPEQCGQPGMPQSAIATGAVDLVLPIAQMPKALRRFLKVPAQVRSHAAPDDERTDTRRPLQDVTDEQLGGIAAVLEENHGFDLRVYRRGTIERRMYRRMTLAGFRSFDRYLDAFRNDAAEQKALLRDLLISVTEFRRDPEAFESLRHGAVTPLVAGASKGSTLRVWVAGCATGEEAYSVAMTFLDVIEDAGKQLYLQVFATDIDQFALETARRAVYKASLAERLPRTQLEKYFKVVGGDSYQAVPRLRDTVSFAIHDLTRDAPFSRIDLVSCRNVLIYLQSKTQDEIIRRFHFALNPDGYLYLGTSESQSRNSELFATVSKKWRLYRKIGESRTIAVAEDWNKGRSGKHGGQRLAVRRESRTQRRKDAREAVIKALLKARVPPTIVVLGDGTITHMHGDLRPYLRFPQGEPRLEISNVLGPELAARIRGILQRCRQQCETVEALASPGKSGEGRIRLIASPGDASLGDGAVLLSFTEVSEDRALNEPDTQQAGQEAIIRQLEEELGATREDLRTTIEELETSNEELRSSNEESLSMNEELQSANEELEATSEELRSLNEELTTVNAQLREKVEQVEESHEDLDNFFASTNIATLFLNEKLCIKRATPAAERLLNVEHASGQFIFNLEAPVLQHGLAQEVRTVLHGGEVAARELASQAGRWYTRRVLPYQGRQKSSSGVVVTFVDITDLKQAHEQVAIRERQHAALAELGLEALQQDSLPDFLHLVTVRIKDVLGADFCKVLELQPGADALLLRAGVGWKEGVVNEATVGTGADSQAGYTLQSADPVIVDDFRTEARFSGPALLTDHGVVSGISCVIDNGQGKYGVLGVHTRYRRRFTQEDANFLQAAANMIGNAIARFQMRSRLRMEGAIATRLAQAVGESGIFDAVQTTLLESLDADLAEIWGLSGSSLVCRDFHAVPPLDPEQVRERFCASTFDIGEAFVGGIYAKERPVWITEFSNKHIFARVDAAKDLGLVSGVGFPIMFGERVLGVVTIFARHRMFVDGVFLETLQSIGRSIGEVLVRNEIEAEARYLADITASSRDAIVSLDLDGTIIKWLAGAEALYGYAGEEMVGRPIDTIVPEELRKEMREAAARVADGESVPPFNTKRISQDGRECEVSVQLSPVTDGEGTIIALTSTDRDVTEQRETERRLKEADQQKDSFLAMLGHELRNPLAAVRSAADYLRVTNGGEGELDSVRSILERQSTHMAKLLDSLLDVSRIVRGRIELDRRPVDFAAICREVAFDAGERIQAKELELNLQISESPVWIDGDRVRLAQVVDNLLSNAINYNRRGGKIELSLRYAEGEAELVVADSGVGIKHDFLPHVFDVFRQAEQGLDRPRGGLGVGLALVKSLVENHGGTVNATSEGPDKGARFVVSLPVTAKRPSSPPQDGARQEGSRVLIIEDNRDSGEMLCKVLELCRHKVWLATNGDEGIELARLHHPDVILCDIGLPNGMSGFDVAKALRENPETRDIFLVALTGYGRPEDLHQSAAAGFEMHVTKPVDLQKLQEIFGQLPSDGKETRQ